MTRPVRLAVLVAALLVAGCGDSSSTTTLDTASGERRFATAESVRATWGDSSLFAVLNEIYHYDSLAEMRKGAALIVDGVVRAVGRGPAYGPPDERFESSYLDVEVIDYLKGRGPETLRISVYVGGHILERNRSDVIGSRIVGFLVSQEAEARRNGHNADVIASYEGQFRFANSQAIFVKSDDGAVPPYAVATTPMGKLRPFDGLRAEAASS
jgi:hypothetical protein